jgi:hypothetical protein
MVTKRLHMKDATTDDNAPMVDEMGANPQLQLHSNE